ncbi:MAG: site-2 protease family protein [Oligoflexia bacterium]|nr:site-2 protease family protein [Oligoflexia bacterium]
MEETFKRVAISILPFFFSLCFHEYAHAWTANRLGDPTAKYAGRLTLNPRVHVDIIWTIIFPVITLILGGIFFGGAKPVPVDSRNFKNPEKGMALVALAGPLSNIFLGIIFAIAFALIAKLAPQNSSSIVVPVLYMLQAGILVNFFLAFFNLLPVPPLDGSKVISFFLPYSKTVYIDMLAPYGFLIIILLWQIGILGFLVGYPARMLYQVTMGFML